MYLFLASGSSRSDSPLTHSRLIRKNISRSNAVSHSSIFFAGYDDEPFGFILVKRGKVVVAKDLGYG